MKIPDYYRQFQNKPAEEEKNKDTQSSTVENKQVQQKQQSPKSE